MKIVLLSQVLLASLLVVGCSEEQTVHIGKGPLDTLQLPAEFQVLSESGQDAPVQALGLMGPQGRTLSVFVALEDDEEFGAYRDNLLVPWEPLDRTRSVGECQWKWGVESLTSSEVEFRALLYKDGYQILITGSGEWSIADIEEILMAVEKEVGCSGG